MKKQILTAIGIVGSIILLLAGIKFIQISRAIAEAASHAPPPETITSIVAEKVRWPRSIESVGTLESVLGATLSAEESGRIAKIHFESGTDVAAGQVLVELDTSVEEAKLQAAQAALNQSEKAFKRAQGLSQNNAMSQSGYESSLAQFTSARAEVDSLKSAIARRKIVAPFAGRTGVRLVNLGAYVVAGTPVVSLHALEDVHVNFLVPQQSIPFIALHQEVVLRLDAYPGKQFIGRVTAINPEVDPASRNLLIQATIANTSRELRPGMFASVSLQLPSDDAFISLPATAIQYAPYGDSVFVIEAMKDPTGKEYRGVRNQGVRLGERVGDRIAVLSGINEGEEIATSGLFKLRPGAAVTVNNSISPTNEFLPKPTDS